MAETKIVGYKNIFGFVLPDWVDEDTIRLIVTFLLSSVTMLFVLIFVIWPKFSEVESLKATLKTNQESLKSLKNSKVGFDSLNEKIPEELQNSVLSAIPQTYSPENAVFLLRKISSETPGVSIVSYKLPSGVLFEANGAKATKDSSGEMVNFISYPIRLTVTAPIESLLLFINKIENSLPFGVVSDLGMQEISKLASSATSKSVQMELEVKFYQSVLKQVDISKINPITNDDLSLVKRISGFSKISNGGMSEVTPVSNEVGSTSGLFGF